MKIIVGKPEGKRQLEDLEINGRIKADGEMRKITKTSVIIACLLAEILTRDLPDT
jgi:hypothetical protein